MLRDIFDGGTCISNARGASHRIRSNTFNDLDQVRRIIRRIETIDSVTKATKGALYEALWNRLPERPRCRTPTAHMLAKTWYHETEQYSDEPGCRPAARLATGSRTERVETLSVSPPADKAERTVEERREVIRQYRDVLKPLCLSWLGTVRVLAALRRGRGDHRSWEQNRLGQAVGRATVGGANRDRDRRRADHGAGAARAGAP